MPHTEAAIREVGMGRDVPWCHQRVGVRALVVLAWEMEGRATGRVYIQLY